MPVDPAAYRQVMGRLATGVTVLTTGARDRVEVMTANAVTSVSLDPVLLLASVGRGCRWGSAARASGSFVVNVLAEGQQDLARWCASAERHDDPSVVLGHAARLTSHGNLVFDEALASFECRRHSVVPVGDHDLLIGAVEDMWVRDGGDPLLFFGGSYARLGEALRSPLAVAACS